jgi:uncharacterized protein
MQVVTGIMRFVLVVVLCAISSPVGADFQAGYDAYERGDYATALREWKPLAEQGDAIAQSNLGLLYAKGRGVPQDYTEAVKWFRKAADQGYADAQLNLGIMYAGGQGVPQDDAAAVMWYRKAANQGHAKSQSILGVLYRNGQGVPQDYVEAAKWYRKAAEQGQVHAQSTLGVLYRYGQGVSEDYAEAVKWYRKAAEQGYASAQRNLGVMYNNGYGVPQDEAVAVKWFRRSAEQGNADAQDDLGIMYAYGQGVPQDEAEAMKWYRKAAAQGLASAQRNLKALEGQYSKDQTAAKDEAAAKEQAAKDFATVLASAEQGDASAQQSLGERYEYGKGVSQSYDQAVEWYRRAAEQGNAEAQYNLGSVYSDGKGVPQDHRKAYFWYALAAAQGMEEAATERDRKIKFFSSVAELAQEEKRVRQWKSDTGQENTADAPNKASLSQTELIRNIQSRLAQLGYNPGHINGVWSLDTEFAAQRYQRDEGLPVTREASDSLLKSLETKQASRKEQAKPANTPSATPREVADLGTFHALVIGIDAYRSLPKLRTAVKDAKAVAALLESRYGFHATTLVNATRDEVIQALEKLRRVLTERDNLLIYYAGHGQLDRGADRGYWLPIDATEESQANWLNNVTITDTLKAIRAKHVMVVADSCYSGTLTRDTRGIEVRVKKSDYVAKTHGKKSRTVLASGGLEPVSDSGGSGHSVFAKAFMDALRDNEGVIDGHDVFAYVRKQVRLNADQVPNYANIRLAGHEVGGDFLFARKPERLPDATPERPAPSANTMTPEMMFWQSIQGSGDPAQHVAYLARFPKGPFATLARNRIDKLTVATFSKKIFGVPFTKNTSYESHGVKLVDGSTTNLGRTFKILYTGVLGNTGFLITESPDGDCGRCSNIFSAYFLKKSSSGWKYSHSAEEFLRAGYFGKTRAPRLDYLNGLALFSVESGRMAQGFKRSIRSYIVLEPDRIIGKPLRIQKNDYWPSAQDNGCPEASPYEDDIKNATGYQQCRQIDGVFKLEKLNGADYLVAKYTGVLRAWNCGKSEPIDGEFRWEITASGIRPVGENHSDFMEKYMLYGKGPKKLPDRGKEICAEN